MSVKGVSYVPKSAECYVVDCTNEHEKTNRNKALSGETKPKSQILCLKMRTKSIITVILLILGISCVVAYINHRYLENSLYCLNGLCKRSEHHILESINSSVHPCENFYEFTCGNWINHHPIPSDTISIDAFTGIQKRTTEQISAYLSQPDSQDEPESVHEARKLYRSCLAAEKFNETVGFEQLSGVLEEVGLPIAPSFTNSSENFSWIATSAWSKKIIDMNFFIEFGISFDPKNHSVKMFSFSKPISRSPLQSQKISRHKKDHEVCQDLISVTTFNSSEYEIEDLIKDDILYKYIIEIAKYMYESMDIPWTEEIETAFDEVYVSYIFFNDQIEELSDMYYDKGPILPKYITLEEFQNITDEISECQNTSSIVDWKYFIQLMFEGVSNVELDFEDRDNTIIILNEEYLKSMMKIIALTPPRVLEFYMWWRTVYGIIPYTTCTLNEVINKYHFELLGSEKRSRNIYCAETVHTVLGHAASYFIIYDDSIKRNMKKISEMVDNIQTAFVEEIENLTWMDEKTREKSLSKLKAMKKWIGYPDWMEDREIFDSFYENITMVEDDYFNNIIQENKRQYALFLEEYHVVENPDDEWTSNPLDVNAFNNIEENVIIIPAGIFPFPFYQLGLEALNYGAIGSVIGHELTHGFDNTGKEYDEVGHLNAWWSTETRREFESKAKCFIDQYNDFNITGILETDNKTTLNGAHTLDENIADNGGLRIAYYAYQNYIEKNGKERQLPALSQYNHNQLFFIAFANTWCEHATTDSLKLSLTDEHSPNFVRVQVTLMNSKEFAKTWNCPVGSPMNPNKDKCQIW